VQIVGVQTLQFVPSDPGRCLENSRRQPGEPPRTKLGRLGIRLYGALQRDVEAFEELVALDEGGCIAEIDASGGYVLVTEIDSNSVGVSESSSGPS